MVVTDHSKERKMKTIFLFPAIAVLGLSTFAHAQQGGDMSTMPGMQMKPKADTMKGMDMDTMMQRCDDMRQKMKSGKPMSPEEQKMMPACDDMDRSMNMPAQPYVPPAERNR
jgi:hypothetical protein